MPKEIKTEAEVKAESKVGVSELHVYGANGKFARTYSAEVHGSKFVDYAEEYAKKLGGKVQKYRV